MRNMEDTDPVELLAVAIERVPGVESVESTRFEAADIDGAALKLAAHSFLPHALLRERRNVETVLEITFEIERNETGLRGLEFLSWFVADLSRSGAAVQLRSVALPPQVGDEVQLGHTLTFIFDALPKSDGEVLRWAESLQVAARLYRSVLFPAGA